VNARRWERQLVFGACAISATSLTLAAESANVDPRLREVTYDARAVVTVPVKRGVVTLVMLDADEVITEVAAGLGGDCAKADAVWCIAAQAGGRNVFVKAKSGANAANNVTVITDRRSHAFRFVVMADSDPKWPVYRLVVKAPAPVQTKTNASSIATALALRDVAPLLALPEMPPLPPLPPQPSPQQVIAERLLTQPQVVNANYALAEGKASADIVPTLVFDDGRFTYFRFGGQRDVPAVFHVLGDGSETLVNTRMEDDLLVVDRVSRRLMLRAGNAVVGVWNEAFDLDSTAPLASSGDGTTVPGVQRTLKLETVGARQPDAMSARQRAGATP
jgi:type IV secretion system protein VirB9